MIETIAERIRAHAFHPLQPDRRTFTVDRELGVPGVADLDDRDGLMRALALRDLVTVAEVDAAAVARGLNDADLHVRSLSAAALGVARATAASAALERAVAEDPEPIVRSYATIALGEMGATTSVPLLRARHASEPDPDVRHQLELAAAQIKAGAVASDAQRDAFLGLREADFGRLALDAPAPDFALEGSDGRPWRLTEARGQWLVLVWIFADWCPVCHREFAELMSSREAFETAGIRVATIEAHDSWRARLMVGREIQPALWGSREWFARAYTERIWWPHLSDPAGVVAARYGATPLTFAVHAEFVNRPTTVIIDPAGVVRFAYAGTFWGDRPSIAQTLDMIRDQTFDFVHPQRLPAPA